MAQKDLTPAEREAELARREAVLAAREAQLAQEPAELAEQRAAFEQGKKSLRDNGDKNFVNPKEKLYDHFPSLSIRWTSSSGCCLRSSPCF